MRYLCIDPNWSGGTPSDRLLLRTIYSGVRFVAFPDGWDHVGHYLNLGLNVALVIARESGPVEQYAEWATADWMYDRVTWFVGNEMDSSGMSSWTMTPSEYAELWQRSRVLHGRRFIGGLVSGDVHRAKAYLQPDAAGVSAHIYTLSPSDAYNKVREYMTLRRPIWVGETTPADGYKLADYTWPAGVNVNDFCYSEDMAPGCGLYA